MSKDNDEIISVKVAGTEYQLYCPKDEQRGLLNAADYLNKKVRKIKRQAKFLSMEKACLLYTSPSPRDLSTSRMPSSA